jgi:hypothetical protein
MHIYIHTHTHNHTHTHTHTHAHTYIHTYIYLLHTQTHTCLYIYVNVYQGVCVCVYCLPFPLPLLLRNGKSALPEWQFRTSVRTSGMAIPHKCLHCRRASPHILQSAQMPGQLVRNVPFRTTFYCGMAARARRHTHINVCQCVILRRTRFSISVVMFGIVMRADMLRHSMCVNVCQHFVLTRIILAKIMCYFDTHIITYFF